MALATLDQLKQELTITRAVHDSELELYLAAASNAILNRVVVDLTAIPPEVTLATLIIAEQLWETRRIDDVDDEVTALRRGFAIPRRAEQLLVGLPRKDSGPKFSFPAATEYPAF
jgi:hypothetical protein